MTRNPFNHAISRFGATLVEELGRPASMPDKPEKVFRGAAVDSRHVEPGMLFAALPGRHADGHDYLEAAAEAGAAILLVDQKRVQEGKLRVTLETLGDVCTVLVVDDVLSALQGLSAEHLDRATHAVRIGVTGSNGKTSTKEMLGSILQREAPTFRSKGNLNSDIGVSLAALSLDQRADFAVFEMAMDHIGEMEQLARIVRPSHAIVTNTAEAHTQFVGSREGVAREKRMIFSQFTESCHGFIPAEDTCADLLAEPVDSDPSRGVVHRISRETFPGFEGFDSKGVFGATLRYRGRSIEMRLPGDFVCDNALLAIACARQLGASVESVVEGLGAVKPLFGRGEVLSSLHPGVDVVVDCYNANPQSMVAALETVFSEHSAPAARRRMLILGDMLELADPQAEHRRLGEYLAALAQARAGSPPANGGMPPVALLIGTHMEAALTAARGTGMQLLHFPDVQSAAAAVRANLHDGDLVLLKGSRSVALESLLPALGVERGNDVA